MSDDKTDNSIIDPKYRDKYSKDNQDWLGTFIDSECTTQNTKEVAVKDEEGNPTGEKETVPAKGSTLHLDQLFDLAKQNGIDTAKYETQADRPNAPGRLRMTLGNMLRARAKKRHGLFNIEGEWVAADSEFVGDSPATENPDGTKIAKVTPEAEAA
jgi:hypothetical protein